MKPFSIAEAVSATGGTYTGPEEALNMCVTSVTTDSRQVEEGALFAAIKGERSDGHDYIAQSYGKGAVLCIGERPAQDSTRPYIRVESTMHALAQLAGWYRGRFEIPVVGITGSVGKTTTKEMVWAVLSQKYRTHKTQMNFNNELGVPLTLLSMPEDSEAAVIEMGISGFGEMTRLRSIVRPTVALISIIGDSHLEFLGSRQGVLKAKAEIFQGMSQQDLAVLNGDDELLGAFDPGIPAVRYGLAPEREVRAQNVHSEDGGSVTCTICYDDEAFDVTIPGYGIHMVYAALAAVTVGRALGLDAEQMKRGIERFETVGRRASILKLEGLTVVDDCYNSNPSSAKAMLRSLALTPTRKVAILGDMLELGEQSDALHEEVGREAALQGIDLVIACGKEAEHLHEGAKGAGARAVWYPDRESLFPHLNELLKRGDTVLVKASHSCRFELITEKLKEMTF